MACIVWDHEWSEDGGLIVYCAVKDTTNYHNRDAAVLEGYCSTSAWHLTHQDLICLLFKMILTRQCNNAISKWFFFPMLTESKNDITVSLLCPKTFFLKEKIPWYSV